MSGRLIDLVGGATALAPEGLASALGYFLQRSTLRGMDRHVDRLVRHLHAEGLAVVPLTFDRTNRAAVDINLYTQALVWKHDAERRAATAEAELAALQTLLTDPPHAVAWGGVAVIRDGGVESHEPPHTAGDQAHGLMTPPAAKRGHLPAREARREET